MFGGKLRFTLYGIWADRRSRSGSRGVGDALARWMVPRELRLAVRGQGRPVLSLCSACQPDTNLEALSQVCYQAPPPPTSRLHWQPPPQPPTPK